jgi:signal transduction histidine kinase
MVRDLSRRLLPVSARLARATDFGAALDALRELFGPRVASSLCEVSGGALVVVAADRDALPVGERRPLPDPAAAERPLADGTVGVATIPLFSTGELVGALIISRAGSGPAAFTDEERELALAVAPHLAHAVAAMRTALLRRRWTSMLLHDFRSPIAVLSMNLDLLQSMLGELATIPDELRDVLVDCNRSLKQLTGMASDLHDISNAEERGITLKRERTSARALVERVVDGVRPLGPRLRFTIDAPEDADIECDVTLVSRVLDNILSNALRYSEPGAEIRVDVGVERAGPLVTIGIENEGRSLDPADGAMLFARYGEARGRGARGLGLYFCRLVIEAHGGTIAVAPPRRRGARFEVALRRARDGKSG